MTKIDVTASAQITGLEPRSNKDLQPQIEALETRILKLKKRSKWLYPATVVLILLASVVTLSTGWFMSDGIHIPSSVSSLFSSDVGGAVGLGGASSLEAIEALQTQIANFIVPAIKVAVALGFGALLYRVGIALFASDYSNSDDMFKQISGGLVLVLAPLFALQIIMPDGANSSPAQELIQTTDDHDFSKVSRLLSSEKVPALAGDYVLAQVTVAAAEPRPELVKRIALAIVEPPANRGFEPRGDAALAIEISAFGEARSQLAISYQAESSRKLNWWRGLGIGFALVALLNALYAGGTHALAGILRRRVVRIKSILGELPTDAKIRAHR